MHLTQHAVTSAFYSTYIAQQGMSWIDDYFDWMKLDGCCRQYKDNHTFCNSEGMFAGARTSCFKDLNVAYQHLIQKG